MKTIAKLTQPQFSYCASCGKSIEQIAYPHQFKVKQREVSIRLFQLCSDCHHRLPWIREVKCSTCGRGESCIDCVRNAKREHAVLLVNRSAVNYNTLMKNWIRQFKFNGDYRLGYMMVEMMRLPVLRQMYEYEKDFGKRDIWHHIIRLMPYMRARAFWHIVTSVPISRERLIERGFNQAAFLAKELSRQLNLPYIELLERTSHTPRMSELTRVERLKAARTMFSCQEAGLQAARVLMQKQGLKLQHSNLIRILIIDDVYTTGGTLRACAHAIKESFFCEVEVYSVTFARS